MALNNVIGREEGGCIPAASGCCFSTLRCRCRPAPGWCWPHSCPSFCSPHICQSACAGVRREGCGLGRREELLFLAALLTYAMVIFKNKVCTFSMESVCPPVSVEAYVECSRETHREVLQKWIKSGCWVGGCCWFFPDLVTAFFFFFLVHGTVIISIIILIYHENGECHEV